MEEAVQIPLQITYRHVEPTEAIENRLREEAAKLEKFYDRIISCRIAVELPHVHHRKGKLYRVRIDLKVPGKELVAGHGHKNDHAHEDLYVAIRDAFDEMRRQLEDHARRQRGQVKRHNAVPPGE